LEKSICISDRVKPIVEKIRTLRIIYIHCTVIDFDRRVLTQYIAASVAFMNGFNEFCLPCHVTMEIIVKNNVTFTWSIDIMTSL
jgi:hypothetical protein